MPCIVGNSRALHAFGRACPATGVTSCFCYGKSSFHADKYCECFDRDNCIVDLAGLEFAYCQVITAAVTLDSPYADVAELLTSLTTAIGALATTPCSFPLSLQVGYTGGATGITGGTGSGGLTNLATILNITLIPAPVLPFLAGGNYALFLEGTACTPFTIA